MTKSKVKALFIFFLLAAVAVCLSLAFVACKGGDKDGGSYGVGEEGVYYYDKDASTEYLMTLQSGTYMISAEGAKGYAGTYSYKESEKSIAFKTDGGESFAAAFSDDAMQLAIADTPYTFLKKVNYTVTFVDGNTSTTQSVTYGKQAVAPEKDESRIFIGWYEDSSFTTSYKFDTAVTGDMTLYAYYIDIDSTIANYEVSFVADGETIYTTETQNGIVYDIPDYDGILGWWVSDTNDGDALTYKYEGQVLNEATKLFAVKEGSLGASVYDNRITWEATVSSVSITVDGTSVASSATGFSFSYAFADLGTGAHDVVITGGSLRQELVYVCNGLARVSNFSVYGSVLVYNAVENAQYYYISVTCGNPSHDHEMVYNGNTLTYDFSECEMGPEGITFTVYAYALGYETSVSDTFVYALILDGTTVRIDSSTDTASWSPVADATGYEVYVNGTLAATVTGTEYSFKNEEKGAEISVAVRPVAPGYYSEISDSVEYTKNTLRTPEITSVSEYTISWDEVEGAVSYELNINGYLVDVPVATYVLSDDAMEHIFSDGVNVISVRAVASTASESSQQSDLVYVTDTVMSSAVTYSDGVVTWGYALAAEAYTVEVDGSVQKTVSGVNSCEVTFTHSGDTVIKIYFDDDSYASLTVYTYAVIFVEGAYALEPVDTMYVAKGDTLIVPELESVDTYDHFAGWYTLPDEFDAWAEGYTGYGSEFVSGSVFDGNSTLILYACWTQDKPLVTMDAGDLGTIDGASTASKYVLYNTTDYTLPVPELTDTTKVFIGWYSAPNGLGIKYTDENGKGLVGVTGSSTPTFYAYYGTAIKLTTTNYGGQTVLEAKAGDDIQYIRNGELTVPATYEINGREYTVAVLNSSAFTNCKYIYTINIPDTIQYVNTANNGYSSGSGAFAQSANIAAVNVYATGDGPDATKEVTYYSEDGVLFRKSALTGYIELIYYPQGKTAANYVIPEYVCNKYEYTYKAGSATDTEPVYNAVTSIATKVFSSHPYLATVTMPATVVNIDSQAFYSCKKLTKVTMLADVSSAEVTAATTISIYGDAFKNCAVMTEITLPSRMTSFDGGMFSGCTVLTTVNVATTGNSAIDNYTSSDGLLLDATGTVLVYYPIGLTVFTFTDVRITEIGAGAVSGNTRIKSVTIPSWIRKIGDEAFSGCTGVTGLTFASLDNLNATASLTIGEQAFYGCTALTEVYLPQNLVTLGRFAFGKCSKLTYVWFDAATKETTLDYADGAFATASDSGDTAGTYYVTDLGIGPNAPAVDIAAVFGYNIKNITVDASNTSYDQTTDGIILSGDGTAVLYCFADYRGAVVLPEGVEEIGDNIFRERRITSVTIPATVTEIGYRAFYNCTMLSEVNFVTEGRDAESLTIGDYAFYGCISLTSMTLPCGLTEMGDRVFYGCTGLQTITLPEGLRTMGDYVFYNCTSLATLELPSTLSQMGRESTGVYWVFYGCKSLTSLNISENSPYFLCEDGILYRISLDETSGEHVKTEVCLALDAATGELILPNTIKKIWYRAFYENVGITKLSFDGELVSTLSIGDEAFNGCTKLKEVVLPEGLTDLGSGMFKNCAVLTTLTIPTTVTQIGYQAFDGCTSITEIKFAEGGTAPLTFTTTSGSNSSSAFYGTSITTLTLPERITDVPDYLCYSLSTLKEVYIPYTATAIGKDAFASCTALEKVVIEDDAENSHASKITTIGLAAFYKCETLTSINLPEALTTMTDGTASTSAGTASTGGAFESCTALKEITLPAKIATVGVHAFYGCTKLEKVTVETGAAVKFGNYAFSGCTALTEVTINGTLTEVGDRAFNGCTGLSTFTMAYPEELVSIGQYGFYQCALTTFTLSSKLTSISDYAFDQTGLTSITIPSDVSKIGNYAFYSCTSLSAVTFAVDTESQKSELSSIGQYAFAKCALTSVSLPETKEALSAGMYAFQSCEELASIYLSSTFTSIYFVFDGCTAITSVTVAQDGIFTVTDLNGAVLLLTSVGANTGADDGEEEEAIPAGSSLVAVFGLGQGTTSTELDLTNTGIVSIGDSCFATNGVITKITIPYTMTYIGRNAFYKATSLKEVVFEELPSGYAPEQYALTLVAGLNGGAAVTAECGVFNYCSALTTINLPERLYVIPEDTFMQCTSLTSLAIPSTVTEIETKAFGTSSSNSAKNLAEITFKDDSNLTTLGSYAFAYLSITTITIPAGVTEIPSRLFDSCSSLAEAKFLSSTITSVGEYAFRNCSRLTSVDLTGTGVTKIETYAFNGSGITNFIVPYTVTSIGGTAFSGCSSLKTVVFEETPDNEEDASITLTEGTSSLTGVFYKCTSLEFVELTSRVTTLPAYMFNNCSSLKVVTYAGDEGYDSKEDYSKTGYFAVIDDIVLGNYVFSGCGLICADISNVDLDELGTYVFSGCTSLTSVKVNDEMTSIPAGLLNGCTSITSFEIPAGVTSIGASAFAGTQITTITLPIAVTTISDGTFSGCSFLTEVKFVDEDGTISDGNITTVGGSAFKDCTQITYLDLTNLETLTGNYAFQNTGLTEVHVPNLQITTDSYMSDAFIDCANLVEVELGAELERIPISMFQNCTSLTKIYYTGYLDDGYTEDQNVLPKSLTAFGSQALSNTGLENIVIPGSVTTIVAGSYSSSTKKYTGVFASNENLTTVIIEDGVQTIGTGTFADCVALVEIEIPYTVTTIGYGVFHNCTALERVTFEELPEGADASDYPLTFWGSTSNTYTYYGVFSDCVNLMEVNLPYRTTELGVLMFYNCIALEEITIPATVNYLLRGTSATSVGPGAYTFYKCTSLTTVTFAAGSVLDNIGHYMFSGCSALETVGIPDGVTAINAYAFQECLSLKGVILPDGLTSIGNNAFESSGLEEILIPATCTSISSATNVSFKTCSSLTSIEVAAGNPSYKTVDGMLVNSSNVIICCPAGREGEVVIDDNLQLSTNYAFYGCGKITRVVLGESCVTLGTYIFNGCSSLVDIVIPLETTKIGTYSFAGCTSLKSVYYMGTAEDWALIDIGSSNNDPLTSAAKYFFSLAEPAFNDAGTDYDGNFWHYDDEGEITVWTFAYATYTVEDGGYVLYSEFEETISYVCIPGENEGTSEVFAVSECTYDSADGTYSVTLTGGGSYTVVLTDADGILTATVTPEAD